MKVLNFGSLNIDYVYRVKHFVEAGETIASTGFTRNVGGKGCNQSVALARAGVPVWHAGCIGEDGLFLREFLDSNHVDTRFVKVLPGVSGHAIIQVDAHGQNCILLHGGANHGIQTDFITEVIASCSPGDILLLQNEINRLPELMRAAGEAGVRIAFNPSPITPAISDLPLQYVHWFLLNEVEGAALTGQTAPAAILDTLLARFPTSAIVLTLGGDGVVYADARHRLSQGIYYVPVADTTAAGDTFTGFFLGALYRGWEEAAALSVAARAAALAVSRPGAAASIPTWEEAVAFTATAAPAPAL